MEQNQEGQIWSIQGIWNESAGQMRREPKARDYISFSDLGKKDFYSRYQKMMGVPESNPTELRVLRVFAAGDEFHHLLKTVFKKTGLFIKSQDDKDASGNNQWSIIEPMDKMLKVLGKYDVLAGGVPNLERAKKAITESDLSDFVKDRSIKIAEYFAEKYAQGLKHMIYEFKSINSMAFWNKKDYLTDAYPHHLLQLYGYLKANQMEEGRILYISKDDLMMAEFPLYYPNEKLEKLLNEDIEQMSHYILNKIEPPKPEDVVFDEAKKLTFQRDKKKIVINGCYVENWEVARSPYFTKMTGFKTVDDWQESIKGRIANLNGKLKEDYDKNGAQVPNL